MTHSDRLLKQMVVSSFGMFVLEMCTIRKWH